MLNAAAAPIEGDEEQRLPQDTESLLFDTDQSSQQQKSTQGAYKNDLLDLMGLGGELDGPPTNTINSASKQSATKGFGLEDLLGGLPTLESNGIFYIFLIFLSIKPYQ